jgi:hypothetical protein
VGDYIEKWDEITKMPNGRLSTSLTQAAALYEPLPAWRERGVLGPGKPPLPGRDTRPHHRISLFLTFKWSRDNASYAYPIKDFSLDSNNSSKIITLAQNGKDDILKIKEDDWIEVSDDITDLSDDSRGTFARVTKSGRQYSDLE